MVWTLIVVWEGVRNWMGDMVATLVGWFVVSIEAAFYFFSKCCKALFGIMNSVDHIWPEAT